MVPSTMSSAQENRSFVAQETSDDSEDEKPIAASRLVRTQYYPSAVLMQTVMIPKAKNRWLLPDNW